MLLRPCSIDYILVSGTVHPLVSPLNAVSELSRPPPPAVPLFEGTEEDAASLGGYPPSPKLPPPVALSGLPVIGALPAPLFPPGMAGTKLAATTDSTEEQKVHGLLLLELARQFVSRSEILSLGPTEAVRTLLDLALLQQLSTGPFSKARMHIRQKQLLVSTGRVYNTGVVMPPTLVCHCE